MNWDNFLFETNNLKNEEKIKSIFLTLKLDTVKSFFKDINKVYSEKTGEPFLIARELEQILFSIPEKYYKYSEFEKLIITYSNLLNTHEFKEASYSISIPNSQLKDLEKNLYIAKDFNSSLSNYFKFILNLVINSSEQSNERSLLSFFPFQLITKDYSIGTIKTNSENEKIFNFKQHGIPFIFILKNSFSKSLNDYIDYDSFFIETSDKKLLKLAVDLYKSNDYVASLSIIAPRIESILRSVIKLKGGSPICLKKTYFSNKTFSEIIGSQEIKDMFSDDMLILLKAIFTSNFGLNIRNKISHGLIEENQFTQDSCLVVLVIILFISSCNFQGNPTP
ncbi:MAG: DUF4209 domain-containing protein [Cetobacterium sp.]